MVRKLSRLITCALAAAFYLSGAELTAAAPNAAWVEYIPQLDDVTTSRLAIEDGFAVAPSTPGLGIDWDLAALDKRAVARAALPA